MNLITSKLVSAVAFLMLCTLALQAQDPAKKADKLYQRYGYQAAIDTYKGAGAGKDSLSLVQINKLSQMAESYRLTGNYGSAAGYYARLVELTDEPNYKLRYAQCLQSLGEYARAKEYFMAYDEAYGRTDPQGKQQAEACARLDRFANREGIAIENLPLNTNKLDLSPFITDEGLYFASNRTNPSRISKQIDIWMNDNFMDVWFAPNNGSSLGEANPVTGDVNTKYHEGSASLYPGNQQIVFTRNLYIKGKRKFDGQKVTRLGLYFAQKAETGDWIKVTEFPFNSQDHSYCHPSISEDGQRLYFASDRPGGYGGYDIYYSKLEDGTWSEPINLGDQINSAGDEHFPILNHGVLYFASKGLAGLGGYDIFYSLVTAEGNSYDHGAPMNLGKPFNSSMDDFGFMPEGDGSTGYFTSNRPGGKGSDDIYKYSMKEPLMNQKVEQVLASKICVYDKYTNKRIPNALVEVVMPDGTNEKYKTDKDGVFYIDLKTSSSYVMNASSTGYKGNKQTLETDPFAGSAVFEYCVPLENSRPKDCFLLTGLVLNGTYNNQPIPRAKVTLQDRCTGDDIEVQSDENGAFEFCLKCGCDYILKGEKGSMTPDSKILVVNTAKCADGKMIQDLVLRTTKLSEVADYQDLLGEGLVIELTNIYYDFDEYYIRDDAKPELDKLVRLLKAFPNMEIELSSHTDARASKGYNETLSANRASAARDYIVSRGIDANRIVAKGYGENRPRNNCRDGVDCTEEQHQYNRRTEVRITKFDNSEIKVEYLDNKPGYIDAKPGSRK